MYVFSNWTQEDIRQIANLITARRLMDYFQFSRLQDVVNIFRRQVVINLIYAIVCLALLCSKVSEVRQADRQVKLQVM